jgi:hypothetical protein
MAGCAIIIAKCGAASACDRLRGQAKTYGATMDSGWLKELRQAGITPQLIALLVFFAFLGLAVARRVLGLPQPFPNAWAYVDSLTVFAFVVVLVLVGHRLLNTVKKTPVFIKRRRLKRQFCSLNSTQRVFLQDKFQHGSRYFLVPIAHEKLRWFEEMRERGLITTYFLGVCTDPVQYEIPVEVWKFLEGTNNSPASNGA